MKPIIRFHDVSYTYHLPNGQSIPALQHVHLTIYPGEFVALMGANGSGKSTLVRLINALFVPTEGTVCVHQWNTRERRCWKDIRRTVAMVFQDPQSQIVGSTVEEDVAFGPRNLGLPQSVVRQRVEWALRTVGMWDLRQRLPFQLSAGQAQRVALAGAIAMKPEVLILDEATAMLDPAGRQTILSLLKHLNTLGMTVVLVTHFPEEASQAQRLIVLHRGTVVADDVPTRVFVRSERLAEWGIAAPVPGQIARRLHTKMPCISPAILDVRTLTRALEECLITSPRQSLSNPSPRPSRVGQARSTFIKTRDLWHVYMAQTPLEVTALRGVTLTVQRGASVGLMGTTGSGKSTLMQHLNGLLFPHRGEVWIDGQEIRQWQDRLPALRRTVAMLFQRAEDQLFERFVGDDVAAGLRPLRLPREILRERVRWAMETVGLEFEAYKDRPVYSLSGGEKRKVALAGVLVLEPQGVILDEPTVGLDPRSRQDLMMYLEKWHTRGDVTLIYSSHSPEEIAHMTDQIVIMQNGVVAISGETHEVLYDVERIKALGLEVPVVVELVLGLRSRGIPLRGNPITMNEFVNTITRFFRGRG